MHNWPVVRYGSDMSSSATLSWPAALTDGVVQLRSWCAADVPAMLTAFRDPWFLRFSDWAPTTTEQALSYQAAGERARLRGSEVHLAIAAIADRGRVVGGVSLHGVDRDQGRAAVGYWVLPNARGGGFATRAVRLIARWAFAEVGLARLELTCGPDNHASQRVGERCGFRQEGLLRSHMPFKGHRRDSLIFSLLPGELAESPQG